MKTLKQFKSPAGQRGFALVTVLMFMVVITIVAIAAMRSTKDEVAVAGARFFRNQAFQQSQSALIRGESCLFRPADCGLASVPDFDGATPGFLKRTDAVVTNGNTGRSGANAWISWPNWATGYGGASDVITDPLPSVAPGADRPQIAVERLSRQTIEGGSIRIAGSSQAIAYMQPYRVTARTVNSGTGSTVLLQRHIWTLAE
jgi:type IV pilus assembly protein PilX